jgi:hypothetical protein
MAVQTRHPRFSVLQARTVVDAGLRRHDGVASVGESIFPPAGTTPDMAFANVLPHK